MKILITGATGFIGSHLLYQLLLHDNIEIKALKRRSSSLDKLIHTFMYYSADTNITNSLNKVEWIDGDLFDAPSLYKATKNVDFVFHTAGMVSFSGSNREKMFKINKEGTQNLVLASIRNQVKKFCYVSSTSVFNRNNSNKVLENSYAISKASADNIVRKSSTYGLQTLIIYPSVVIGYGNGESGFEKILHSIWQGNLFYTSGGAEFVDIRDVTRAIINLTMSNLYNKGFVVSSEYFPYKRILELAATALHKPKPFIPLGYNIAKFINYLGQAKQYLIHKDPLISNESLKILYSKNNGNYKKRMPKYHTDYIPIQDSVMELGNYYVSMRKENLNRFFTKN